MDHLRHDFYPRIDTRDGGALTKACEGKTLIVTGASEGIGRVRLYHLPIHLAHFPSLLRYSIATIHAHTPI